MLIRFKVENYRSFKDPVTINFEASSLKELQAENIAHAGGLQLLRCMSLYGANSSGKSNIFKAMVFMKKFILNSIRNQDEEFIDVMPFVLNTESEKKPSSFEVEILIDDIKYRYGFTLDRERIHQEYLYYTKINKEYNYFLRKGDNITLDEKFTEGKDLENKTRPDSLFVSVASQFNGAISMSIVKWFNDFKYVYDTNNKFLSSYSMKLFENSRYKNLIKRYLLRADLGFSDIDAHKLSMPDDLEDYPIEVKNIIQNQYKKENTLMMTEHSKYDALGNNVGKVLFNFNELESLGTQKYFALSGLIIETLLNGAVLIIDEFDARMHPKLCLSIINLFNSKDNNIKSAQLLFISHNTNFINKEIFRRDQILLASKDKYGATEILKLSENNNRRVRIDEAYEKNYLDGKYLAVPKITSFNLFDPI